MYVYQKSPQGNLGLYYQLPQNSPSLYLFPYSKPLPMFSYFWQQQPIFQNRYSFLRVVLGKYHQVGGLNQQKLILLQSCGWAVGNHVVNRAMVLLKFSMEPPLPLPSFLRWQGSCRSLACSCSTTISPVITRHSPCVFLHPLSPLLRDTRHTELTSC